MSLTARDRLLAYLRQTGLSTARAEATIDAFVQELAEHLREWGEDGGKRQAADGQGLPLHRSPFFMYEDADVAADLIAELRSAGPVRPDEEQT